MQVCMCICVTTLCLIGESREATFRLKYSSAFSSQTSLKDLQEETRKDVGYYRNAPHLKRKLVEYCLLEK